MEYSAGVPAYVKLQRLAIAVGAALENREKWGKWFDELQLSYLTYEFTPVVELLAGKVERNADNARRAKTRLGVSGKSPRPIIEQCFIYTLIDNLEYQLAALEKSAKLTGESELQAHFIEQTKPIKERLVELREMLEIKE